MPCSLSMPVNASFEEPGISPRARRALAAVWISLGLHAAVIALVQVAPPGATGSGGPVIEARLVSASPPAADPQASNERTQPPVLAPSALAEAQPVPGIMPQPETTQPDALVQPATVSPGPLSASSPAPALAITSSVDLTYYGARDVDVLPRALREVQPDYPTEADRQRISGKVRLQVKIEADGRVSDIDVVSADPPGVFDEAAVRAFRAARFVPAEKNGRPVRVRVLISVEFDWEGRPRQP